MGESTSDILKLKFLFCVFRNVILMSFTFLCISVYYVSIHQLCNVLLEQSSLEEEILISRDVAELMKKE